MKSELPKVLHKVCGRPMLGYVLDACRLAGADRLVVVVGHGKEQVMGRFAGENGMTWVEQPEQKGTGHAVRLCRRTLEGFSGSVLVVAGDMPLVRRETLALLLESREQNGDALTLATTFLDDPTGYGRIIRDDQGRVAAIVEERDCTPEQRAIREVNPSYYCFDGSRMWDALEKVRPAANKGEYYVTDTVAILRDAGESVSAVAFVPAEEATGINSRLDLARVCRLMQDRIQLDLMEEGVTIADPDNTWIEAGVAVGRDTMILPFTFIETGARIGEGCRIGPFAWIRGGQNVADGSLVAFQAPSTGEKP
jgi:bifunctional UDP-N-acetylglucosamine pyrophosphorylase/glucosamine-1-phosphate N-acetyltransferase